MLIGDEINIPNGWRKLFDHERLLKGDKYFTCSSWQDTGLIGNKAGDLDFTYIRKVDANAVDLKSTSFSIPTISISDRVKNYLKKVNA